MTKKHGHETEHAHCEHCLHACDHCDVAYCCDCNREWGTCRQRHWPDWYSWTTAQIPGTIPLDTTGGSASNYVLDNSASLHEQAHIN